jgi:hypothetical protein
MVYQTRVGDKINSHELTKHADFLVCAFLHISIFFRTQIDSCRSPSLNIQVSDPNRSLKMYKEMPAPNVTTVKSPIPGLPAHTTHTFEHIPPCQFGGDHVFEREVTGCGLAWAILCWPCGLYCLLTDRVTKCIKCNMGLPKN